MAGSTGPAWTDDKHFSYLNSIEQTFVQSLYGQDYNAVDAPAEEEGDQDCVESRPVYAPYGSEVGPTSVSCCKCLVVWHESLRH
jgi:hypothetical protein